jgi:AraC family transcriptional regulator
MTNTRFSRAEKGHSYEAVYADHVLERRDLVGSGALIRVDQAAKKVVNPLIPDLVIGVGTRGKGGYEADLGRGRFRGKLGPNQTILIPPDACAVIDCEGPHSFIGWSMSYFALLELATEELDLPRDGDFGRLHAEPLAEGLAAPLISALWTANGPGGSGGTLFNQSAIITLLGLLRAASRKAPKPKAKLAPWQLKRTLERMESGFAQDLSLETLAREVRLSPFHFLRSFKEDVGRSPHQHLVRVRIERAKSLLEATDLAITEVAARVGYSDPGQLTRLFRREVHCTPREYRKQAANPGGSD